MIAHRLSTVRLAHRIVVFHEGRLVEEGTHDELLSLDGVYRRLHALQFTPSGVGDTGS
jgi:ABC-type multidrug transport system fused ATPase/permease subunit